MFECQVPSSLDEVDGDQPAYLTQQDYSTSAGYPAKEATGGFKGAFKKVANGIAGTQIAPPLVLDHYCCQRCSQGHSQVHMQTCGMDYKCDSVLHEGLTVKFGVHPTVKCL